MKKTSKVARIVIVTAVLLVVGAYVYAGGSSEESETSEVGATQEVTVRAALGVGWANGWDAPWNDVVAREVTRITGVNIENIPVGESLEIRNEKINIWLASGDYPELIHLKGDEIPRWRDEQAIIPLDDLIEQYGQNIQRVYGDEVLNKYRDPEDGNIYYLMGFHGGDADGFFSMNFKYSLLKQVDPDLAANPRAITPEEYVDLLVEFRRMFPTLNGLETIGITTSFDQKWYDGNQTFIGLMKAAYGIGEFSEDERGNLSVDVKDPRYVDVLILINRLVRENLIDPEWPTVSYQNYAQKLAAGNVFSTSAAWFEPLFSGIVPELEKDGPDGHYYPYVVAAAGVENPPYLRASNMGDNPIVITDNAENPQRIMQLLDFLASEEGAFLVRFGPEGYVWERQGDERALKEEYVAEFQEDPEAFYDQYGINNWQIMNPRDHVMDDWVYSDGTTWRNPPDADTPIQRLSDFQRLTLLETTYAAYDPWPYLNIVPPVGTDLGDIYQSFQDRRDQFIHRLLLDATSDAEIEAALEEFIVEANELGIEELEAYATDQYRKRLSIMLGD